MKEKGKYLDSNNYLEFNNIACKKHPYFSSVGICSYCLNDRLINLVCSACGEQRVSSCSCSDISSACNGDIGSIGRISCLLENENEKDGKKEGEKNMNGFWKIRRLFVRNKKEKGSEKNGKNDEKVGKKSVSRSRSLCSFRGGGSLSNDVDEGSEYGFQSGKISDVAGGVNMFNDFESRKSGFRCFSDVDSEPRNSGFRGFFDAENEPRKTGFRGFFNSENEPRKNGFRGLFDAENEARKNGFRGFFDAENEARKTGFRGLFDGENEARKSGFRGKYYDCSVENGLNSLKVVRKMGGPGELNRVNSVPNRSIFPVKETEFSAINVDDDNSPGFIDFKVHHLSSSKSKRKFSFADSSESNRSFSSSVGDSCRRIGNDEEVKKGGRGSNSKGGWKWMFFRQNSGRRSTSK